MPYTVPMRWGLSSVPRSMEWTMNNILDGGTNLQKQNLKTLQLYSSTTTMTLSQQYHYNPVTNFSIQGRYPNLNDTDTRQLSHRFTPCWWRVPVQGRPAEQQNFNPMHARTLCIPVEKISSIEPLQVCFFTDGNLNKCTQDQTLPGTRIEAK